MAAGEEGGGEEVDKRGLSRRKPRLGILERTFNY